MAQNDWILDVLADLKAFASANDLGALAEQLDDTVLIAAAEISSQKQKVRVGIDGQDCQFESDNRGIGRHQSA
ncbi:MAG: hypothetical protein AB8B51_06975 [Sedimentitalea sp.]